MTSAIMMERAGMNVPGMPMSSPSGMMGTPAQRRRYERRDGSSLHDDFQEVHRRNEGRLRVRR